MKTFKAKTFFLDALLFLAGSLMMGFSIQYFAAPHKISIGGITGVATMLNFVTDGLLPIGTTALILNIPLFILAAIYLGRSMLLKTIVGTVMSSLSMDMFALILGENVYKGDMLLAALFGGVIGGLGLGLIFLRGGTTGGVDIIVRLLKLKIKFMETGRLMLFVEGLLLAVVTAVYRDINIALYSVITIYLYSKCIDTVLYGIDAGKSFFIISDKNREIAGEIMAQVKRGVTFLKGTGAYTESDKEIILIALRNSETVKVREIVYNVDPKAFIIVTSTSETIGEGFKSIKDNK